MKASKKKANQKAQRKDMIEIKNFDTIDAGDRFLTYISKVDLNNEIFFTGSSLSRLFPRGVLNGSISFDERLIYNVPLSDKYPTKTINLHGLLQPVEDLPKNAKEQDNQEDRFQKYTKLKEHKPPEINLSDQEYVNEKLRFPFLKKYHPVQVSCFKNSAVILLKTGEEVMSDLNSEFQKKEYQNLFKIIVDTLTNKKFSFYSYFLQNIDNDLLKNLDDSKLYWPYFGEENSMKPEEKYWRLYHHYFVPFSDFQDKITNLCSHIPKCYKDFVTLLRSKDIIIDTKINILRVYQALYNLNSICSTKIIVLGDFAKDFYSNYTTLDREKWLTIYNTTLSFELTKVVMPIKKVSIGRNHLLLLTIEGDIFAIGDGTRGATGTRTKRYHCDPIKINFDFLNTKISQISAGSRHSLALDTENNLFAWGCGAYGCLGNNSTIDAFEPKGVSFSFVYDTITQISAGDSYSACVTSDGTLITWGNTQFDRLGLKEDVNNLVPNKVLENIGHVVKIKAGYLTFLVANKKNMIYGFGLQTICEIDEERKEEEKDKKNNNKSNLISKTIDLPDNRLYKFLINTGGAKVTNLFVGENFFGFTTSQSELTAKGPVNLCGLYKIGELQSPENKLSLSKIDEIFNVIGGGSQKSKKSKMTSRKRRMDTSKSTNGALTDGEELSPIAQKIDKSEDYLAKCYCVKDDSKQKLEFGECEKNFSNLILNYEKEGGDSDLLTIQILKGMETITNEYSIPFSSSRIVGERAFTLVRCSANNTALLTNSQDLYVFGSSSFHVAPEAFESCYIPIQPSGRKIRHIALGKNHILMVTQTKELFVAGRNLEGQLGLGFTSDFVDIRNAKPVETLKLKNIIKCYANENFSIVIEAGMTNKVYIFGDLPFLQNSHFVNKTISPKEVDWGDVHKIACGSTHILLLKKEENNLFAVYSIGNGMYGKLGDGDPDGKNHYTPIKVKLPFYEMKISSDCKIRAGKYTSACIIKERGGNDDETEKHNFYCWGLCYHGMISNNKEVKKHNFGDSFPIDNCLPVINPILVKKYDIIDLAIGERAMFLLGYPNGELISLGKFSMKKVRGQKKIMNFFKKIQVGLNHAGAINKKGKIYTWGSNISNKLCFENVKKRGNDEEDEGDDVDEDLNFEIDDFWTEYPTNAIKVNKVLEDGNKQEQSEEMFNLIHDNLEEENDEKNEKEENTEKETPPSENEENAESYEEKSNEDKEEVMSTFAKTKNLLKKKGQKFDQLEDKVRENEQKFQEDIKEILKQYSELDNYRKKSKLFNLSLKNIFYFIYSNYPMNIEWRISDKKWSKFPSNNFVKYRDNFKALLSTLHTHPCYFLRIYENNLMNDKDLYKIIKQVYKPMRYDKFSQLVFISLMKGVLQIEIKRQKLKNLEDFKIVKEYQDNKEELSLFGRLWRLLFKIDYELLTRQEICVAYIIGHMFVKSEDTSNPENDYLLERKTGEEVEMSAYQKSTRLKKILELFDYFYKELLVNSNLDKNQVYSLIDSQSNYDPLIRLNEMQTNLINEVIEIFNDLTEDKGKIQEYLVKIICLIMFNHFLKVLGNPMKLMTVNFHLQLDNYVYMTFMKRNQDNFYCISKAFRTIFQLLSMKDSANLLSNDFKKLLDKSFDSSHQRTFLSSLRDLISEGNMKELHYKKIEKDNKEIMSYQDKQKYDNDLLHAFFQHSLNDRNYIINIQYNDLIKLYKTIVTNREKIRLSAENVDVVEQILKHNGLLASQAFINDSIQLDQNPICQFKLKTKTLSIKKPTAIGRCRNCLCPLLSDYIFLNEIPLYETFNCINKNSAIGYFIKILLSCELYDLKDDNFNMFIKSQLKAKKSDKDFVKLVDRLYSLMAVELKDNLILSEDIISDPDKLKENLYKQPYVNKEFLKYCKKIQYQYQVMRDELIYHKSLKEVFSTIKNDFTDKKNKIQVYINKENDKNQVLDKKDIDYIQNEAFLYNIYDINRNQILRGYGNPEFVNDINYVNGSIFKKVVKKNEKLPRSEGLSMNMPSQLKKQLRVKKRFYISKLIEKGVIKDFLMFKKEILSQADIYQLGVLKTEDFEFNCNLLKITGQESSKCFGSCSSSNVGNESTKTIHSFTLKNEELAELIEAGTSSKGGHTTCPVGNLFKVYPRQFLKILNETLQYGQ